MNQYKFKWGNKNRVGKAFDIPATTLNDWASRNDERCELLELGLSALNFIDSNPPAQHDTGANYIAWLNSQETAIEEAAESMGFTGKVHKVLGLIPAHNGWAARQLDNKRPLVIGLLMGITEKTAQSLLAKHESLANWNFEVRRAAIEIAINQSNALNTVLNHMEASRRS